ncbi:MAG: exodeoxyribonuclease I [Methylococcales bacterium]
MQPNSFYWIDYETFGADPRVDRPSQFAGLRTDSQLNVIDDPLVLFCQQANDYLPHPEACLITGITPQIANQKGVCESDFIQSIQTELQVPGTCTVGYNNIRFDDEITRHSLYRNLLDPYAHEWRNNNSRWDLIDVMRLMCALRPEGIKWPHDENGNPVFRLEKLTEANAIEHGKAHDALADVEATIALARLVQKAQPKLFRYCVEHRIKSNIFPLLNVTDMAAVLHVSSRYSASRHCIAMIAPIVAHPVNKNGIIVYDLAVNPEPLIELDADAIAERLFTHAVKLPESVERIALKTVHANKCPIVAPVTALREQDAVRLNIDQAVCDKHLAMLKSQQSQIQKKLLEVFREDSVQQSSDPDYMLYSGGFIGDRDKNFLRKLHTIPINELVDFTPAFQDQRLSEMLFRYRARNYPETLTADEQLRWDRFRSNRLKNPEAGAGLSFLAYQSVLKELNQRETDSHLNQKILEELENYANTLVGGIAEDFSQDGGNS